MSYLVIHLDQGKQRIDKNVYGHFAEHSGRSIMDGPLMVLTPTYHVFDMYQVHQDAIMLPCSLETDLYTLNDQHIPQVSASASLKAGGNVYLTLSNADPHREAEVPCELRSGAVSAVTGTILNAPEMGTYNTFQEPERVKPTAFKRVQFNGEKVTAILPPMSVCVLSIEVRS